MKWRDVNNMRVKFAILPLLAFFVWTLTGEALAAKPSADTCYSCHSQLKKQFAQKTIHDPVGKGQCMACHNPHAANQDKFLKDEINKVCYSCHKGLAQELGRGYVHSVLLHDKCTRCHNPHASAHSNLLAKEANSLCLDCHEGVKKQLTFSYPIPPFREKKCLSCHQPHVSKEEGLVKKNINRLCQDCHGIKCKSKGVSLAFALQNADCTNCHNPHASNKKGVFNPIAHQSFVDQKCEACHDTIIANKPLTTKLTGRTLCFDCHGNKKDMLSKIYVHGGGSKACTTCHNPHASQDKGLIWKKEKWLCISCHADTDRREKASIEKQKGIRCTAIKEGKCSHCHDPHAENMPHYFKGDGVDICVSCHKKEHSLSHPLREKSIDPRTNQPTYCTTCHGMHTAENKFMLYFDRKKELCIECHKRD